MADPEDLPRFDAERLAAEIRKGDPEAVALAAKQLFDTGLGRHVLAAFLIENGVGQQLGRPGMSPQDLAYQVGRHDAALSLVETVYDQASLIVTLFNSAPPTLEENHEPEPDLEGQFIGGLGDVSDLDDFG